MVWILFEFASWYVPYSIPRGGQGEQQEAEGHFQCSA